jgi:hypothetical protein
MESNRFSESGFRQMAVVSAEKIDFDPEDRGR